MILLFILVAMLLVAMGLLTRGFRGVAIDNHPLCRKCGFDLFGRSADTLICCECGRDLKLPRAIRIGHRQRRLGSVMVGALLVAIVLGTAGVVSWGSAHHVNWWRHAPLWYVLAEASSPDPKHRSAALGELIFRCDHNQLSPSQWNRVISAGLAYQRDVSKPWDFGWGDLLENAHSNGKFSSNQWNTYLSQSLDDIFSLRVRQRVRRGDPLPVEMSYSQPRTSQDHLMVTAGRKRLELQLGDQWVVIDQSDSVAISPFAMHGGGDFTTVDRLDGPGIVDGVQHSRFEEHLELRSSSDFETPPELSRDIQLPADFTLLPSSQSSVTLVHNPFLKKAIEACLFVDANNESGWDPKRGTFKGIDFEINNGPPVGLGFDVYINLEGKQTMLGSFSFAANEANGQTVHGRGVRLPWPSGKTATVDLILRPNPDVAVRSVNTFEVWDGEIVFNNVPLR